MQLTNEPIAVIEQRPTNGTADIGAHCLLKVRRRIGRRAASLLVALALILGVTAMSPAPAGATGKAIVPGPGATVITVDWTTVARTTTTERLWVQLTAATVGKVNTCGTGLSVWYNDASGVRRNLYQADDNCIWGPVWSRWTPSFTAKRGTCVQVTYRMDGTWRSAATFCIK